MSLFFFRKIVAAINSQTLRNVFSFLGSSFFWLISISTIIAILLSYTKAKNYEGAGASKLGSIFIYILVATIGMKMDLNQAFENPGLMVIGFVWISIHAILLIIVAKIIKAPYFFLALGSQANVGGAASAPIVAQAFHPSLATVGVLLAVFGYAIGTVGAILCTIFNGIICDILNKIEDISDHKLLHMKKIIILLIVSILITACSSEKETNMLVQGQIKGLKKGTLYLQKMKDSLLISVDSIDLLGNDRFSLTDNVISPVLYYLTFDGNTTNKRILFFGEEGTITINDKLDRFGYNPEIIGSKNQEILDKYNTIKKKFQNKRLGIDKRRF